MKWQEENLDVLQNLEFAIVGVWRANPEMTMQFLDGFLK